MRYRDIAGRDILTSQAALDIGMFGDGSDVSPVLDGTTTYNAFSTLTNPGASGVYTLSRSIFCLNLTVNGGITLKTAGFKIFCTGTLTNNGTITNSGSAGGNASGSSGGSAAGA